MSPAHRSTSRRRPTRTPPRQSAAQADREQVEHSCLGEWVAADTLRRSRDFPGKAPQRPVGRWPRGGRPRRKQCGAHRSTLATICSDHTIPAAASAVPTIRSTEPAPGASKTRSGSAPIPVPGPDRILEARPGRGPSHEAPPTRRECVPRIAGGPGDRPGSPREGRPAAVRGLPPPRAKRCGGPTQHSPVRCHRPIGRGRRGSTGATPRATMHRRPEFRHSPEHMRGRWATRPRVPR